MPQERPICNRPFVVAGNQPAFKSGGRGRFVTFKERLEEKKMIVAELKFTWKCGVFLTCGQLAVVKISWGWTVISFLLFKVDWRSMMNVFSPASSPLISIFKKRITTWWHGYSDSFSISIQCCLPCPLSHRPLTEFKVELIDSSYNPGRFQWCSFE